jgi:GAF domain-containing protein
MSEAHTWEQDSRLSPEQSFAELGLIMLEAKPLSKILDRVAELGKQAIPGHNEVSVTLIDNDQPRSVAFTGDLAVTLDERQYEDGFGPCMHAAATGSTIVIADTADDASYPEFARQCLRKNVHHTISVGLPIPQGTVGALNIYSLGEAPLDDQEVQVAQGFATYAAVALANAALLAKTSELSEQMQRAMQSRAVIDQAKGILMAAHRCSPEEAFAMLSDASQRSNRKLRDLAADMVQRVADGGA